MKSLYILLLLIVCLSCKNNPSETSKETQSSNSEQQIDDTRKTATQSQGIVVYDSIDDLDIAYTNLKAIFDKNPSIGIVAEINHSLNARKVDVDLPTTKAIFFGNPNLGTSLMQVNPLTGLDLPQKVIYIQDKNGKNQIIYNDVEYLNRRYALENHKKLPVISNTLKALIERTSGSQNYQSIELEVSKHQGIVTKESNYNFASTLDRLMTILERKKGLKVIATLDHQANAKKAGLELTPTYLVVFGNPKIGSPLMETQQSLALDLPQKMLVWEDKTGQSFVSYNDIYFLKERHQIDGHDRAFKKINTVLDKISSEAVE
ncbi:DUF302 domain-containing protein [Mesohalobacter halotolerans]|uniref:DUF302 domain-containing protein n=1 Tax=Mesohalobacter halotolerans TaxID=1883405 RepID=A0A4U5TTQ7_9FLAO|nr:DUF302 domain-containing protein [Mesohalobacter halotolerans]MBS3739259.1 DUF302 domain-containing protein [Psychroflexus sp.]TKS57616.1 DUF302 domain-containing protein [Mesohalobacter halotolerans]